MTAHTSHHRGARGRADLGPATRRRGDPQAQRRGPARRRAEADGEALARRLDDAEARAAEAILRVAELEAELDVLRAETDTLRAELSAWQSQPVVRHA